MSKYAVIGVIRNSIGDNNSLYSVLKKITYNNNDVYVKLVDEAEYDDYIEKSKSPITYTAYSR